MRKFIGFKLIEFIIGGKHNRLTRDTHAYKSGVSNTKTKT